MTAEAKMLKEIGQRVRMARANKSMSQAQLAEALRVSSPYISNIEQGKQAMSVITLCGICEALDVSADWVLRDCTPESRRITDSEIAGMMEDCTPEERRAIRNILQSVKDAMRSMRGDFSK